MSIVRLEYWYIFWQFILVWFTPTDYRLTSWYWISVDTDIDRYVGEIRRPTLTPFIPISEKNMSDKNFVYRYRKGPNIDIRIHSYIWFLKVFPCVHCKIRILVYISTVHTRLIHTHGLSTDIVILNIGKMFIPISDIMSDSALSVRHWRFRYNAQSDIVNHG